MTVTPRARARSREAIEQLADRLERGARPPRVGRRLVMLEDAPVGVDETRGHRRPAHVHPDHDLGGHAP